MDLSISKAELSRALSLTQSIVEKKTTMPILANVLLTSSDGVLKVSSTNLELTSVTEAKANVKASGSTTVSAKVFSDIVRELPDGDVSLRLAEGERLEIESHSSKFKMVGVSSEEYPSLPGMGVEVKSKINGNQLLEMIQKTIYAVSHDETRFNLNGVCFELVHDAKEKNSLQMVATDGHRLAMVTRPVKGISLSKPVIVPTKGLSDLRKVIDASQDQEIGVEIQEGFFVIEAPSVKISMRLIDGEFPDYNQVIPKVEGIPVRVKSEDLEQALRRSALMVTDKGKCVKFDFSKNKLRMSSSSPELGESSEELEIEYDGEPLSIGFNAKYLLDFIGALSENQEMILELNGELGPGKLTVPGDESCFGIVMPMRLA